MTSILAAAATVDPNDPASVQRIADMARSSQHAATAIADYTTKVCGVTLATPRRHFRGNRARDPDDLVG